MSPYSQVEIKLVYWEEKRKIGNWGMKEFSAVGILPAP